MNVSICSWETLPAEGRRNSDDRAFFVTERIKMNLGSSMRGRHNQWLAQLA